MAVQWSDNIVVLDLSDEPVLADELGDVLTRVRDSKPAKTPHVVLNMANVSWIGSSNIGQLIAISKLLAERERLLKLCSTTPEVRSIFQVTGLGRVFHFAPDPMTALAGIQLAEA